MVQFLYNILDQEDDSEYVKSIKKALKEVLEENEMVFFITKPNTKKHNDCR